MKQINLQDNLRKKFIKQGVKMIAPDTVFFSKDTKIGKNVSIDPYVVIRKKVKIQNNVKIFSFSHLENVRIENNVNIGPYARLRPGTILKSGSRIGNFVEIKKSTIEKNSKINHLSYIGDTSLGKNVNIGAGTITCNYDGVKKNKTIMEFTLSEEQNLLIDTTKSFVKNELMQHEELLEKTYNLPKELYDEIKKKSF